MVRQGDADELEGEDESLEDGVAWPASGEMEGREGVDDRAMGAFFAAASAMMLRRSVLRRGASARAEQRLRERGRTSQLRLPLTSRRGERARQPISAQSKAH